LLPQGVDLFPLQKCVRSEITPTHHDMYSSPTNVNLPTGRAISRGFLPQSIVVGCISDRAQLRPFSPNAMTYSQPTQFIGPGLVRSVQCRAWLGYRLLSIDIRRQ
jgi:hypothetical protein